MVASRRLQLSTRKVVLFAATGCMVLLLCLERNYQLSIFDALEHQRDALVRERDEGILGKKELALELHTTRSALREQRALDELPQQNEPIKATKLQPSEELRVCSMLRHLLPDADVYTIIERIALSAPPGGLIVDVGLAHGKECFRIAELGRRCDGFEADPVHAREVTTQARLHANGSLIRIFGAAVGNQRHGGNVSFAMDTHTKFGVGGTLSVNKTQSLGWDVVQVPMIRLEEQYAATPHEAKEVIHLLKSDTQGHEIGVLRGARKLFWERRVRFVLVEMDLSLAGGRAEGDKVIRYLASYGFVCCDMKWHDDKGRPYEGSHGIGNSTLVGHWVHALGLARTRKHGRTVSTDLFCEHVGKIVV